jgi:hypothetical protein
MIKIEIEDKIYNLPSNWDEISLGQLMDLNEVNKRKFISDVDHTATIVESISDLPADIFLELPLEDFKTLSDLFDWIGTLPTKSDIEPSIIIDGVKYVPVDLRTLSAGEFISLEVFQNEGDVNKNLHLISSILIRPEVDGQIEKLKDIVDIQKRAELFKEKLMVGIYWPIVDSFFYGAASSSLTNMSDSLEQPKSPSKLKIINS